MYYWPGCLYYDNGYYLHFLQKSRSSERMKCPLANGPHINTLTKKQLKTYTSNCAFDVSAPSGLLKGPTPDTIKIYLTRPIKRGEELLSSHSIIGSACSHVQDHSVISTDEYQAALDQQPAPQPLELLSKRKGNQQTPSWQTPPTIKRSQTSYSGNRCH